MKSLGKIFHVVRFAIKLTHKAVNVNNFDLIFMSVYDHDEQTLLTFFSKSIIISAFLLFNYILCL